MRPLVLSLLLTASAVAGERKTTTYVYPDGSRVTVGSERLDGGPRVYVREYRYAAPPVVVLGPAPRQVAGPVRAPFPYDGPVRRAVRAFFGGY